MSNIQNRRAFKLFNVAIVMIIRMCYNFSSVRTPLLEVLCWPDEMCVFCSPVSPPRSQCFVCLLFHTHVSKAKSSLSWPCNSKLFLSQDAGGANWIKGSANDIIATVNSSLPACLFIHTSFLAKAIHWPSIWGQHNYWSYTRPFSLPSLQKTSLYVRNGGYEEPILNL